MTESNIPKYCRVTPPISATPHFKHFGLLAYFGDRFDLHVQSVFGQGGDLYQSVGGIFTLKILGEQRLLFFPVRPASRGCW